MQRWPIWASQVSQFQFQLKIEKSCAVSWAAMGGQARGEPYRRRCRALGIRRPSAWAPQTGFVIAGMAFRIGGSRSRGWRGARSFPSRSHPNPRPRRSSHPRSTSTEPVRVRPSVRRDGRHKTLRQRPLCPRKLRITLLFSTRLRSLDRDNQFENRFLTLLRLWMWIFCYFPSPYFFHTFKRL